LKEKPPTNIGEFTVGLGKIEVLRQGSQITVVTYGSMCRIVEDASVFLKSIEVDIEVIDCQTLLPFDLNHDILKSLKKTNRLLIVDEDMEGGASAFILKRIIEDQNGYNYLDAAPVTLTSKSHRPAYGSDGDYFSKPSFEDIVEAVLELVGK
jgi:pyruvate/2-oxoglutarate/acetoin dehydrogenase E1 component